MLLEPERMRGAEMKSGGLLFLLGHLFNGSQGQILSTFSM